MTFKALAALLTYPEADLLEAIPEIERVLEGEAACNREAASQAAALLTLLKTGTLTELQQNYVATFDQNPSHSLHLFEHVHGESRDRGPAMVNLLDEYGKRGLTVSAAELPDYVPLFLEYLSLLPAGEALSTLGEAVHVLAVIGRKLAASGSPYSSVFSVLEAISPVRAQPLPGQPERDMEEAVVTFGTGPDGVEPLLAPASSGLAYAAVPNPHRRQPPAAQTN